MRLKNCHEYQGKWYWIQNQLIQFNTEILKNVRLVFDDRFSQIRPRICNDK